MAISSFLFLELRRKQHYLSDYSKIVLLFTVTIKYDREKHVCTGYELLAFVTYITNFAQKMDYVVMAIRVNRPKLNQ